MKHTNNFMETRIIFIFVLTLLIGCKNRNIDYKYCKVKVDSTEHVYWWSNYYKLKVFYHFNVNDTLVYGDYIDDEKTFKWSASFSEGDSVIIRYEINNPQKSIILKRTYIKSKDYYVP